MIDGINFNADEPPKGRPYYDPTASNEDVLQDVSIYDVNANFALKDLKNISLFLGNNRPNPG